MWLLYALPLVIVSWVAERPVTYALAGLCTALMVLDVLLNPPNTSFALAALNYLLGIAVLWIMAVILAQRRDSRQALVRQNALLESNVAERTAALTTTLAALSESESRYRAIGELIPYGVWVCDPGGGTLYLSDAFLEMVGKTLDECRHLVGSIACRLRMWSARWPTGRRAARRRSMGLQPSHLGQGWHAAARSEPRRADARRRRTVTAWVGINLDITEQVQADEELRSAGNNCGSTPAGWSSRSKTNGRPLPGSYTMRPASR